MKREGGPGTVSQEILELRFLSQTQFASRTGLDVPIAGASGLE